MTLAKKSYFFKEKSYLNYSLKSPQYSYEKEFDRIREKYNLKGAGSWALGQEDPSIWDHYEEWVNGEMEDTTPSPLFLYTTILYTICQ